MPVIGWVNKYKSLMQSGYWSIEEHLSKSCSWHGVATSTKIQETRNKDNPCIPLLLLSLSLSLQQALWALPAFPVGWVLEKLVLAEHPHQNLRLSIVVQPPKTTASMRAAHKDSQRVSSSSQHIAIQICNVNSSLSFLSRGFNESSWHQIAGSWVSSSPPLKWTKKQSTLVCRVREGQCGSASFTTHPEFLTLIPSLKLCELHRFLEKSEDDDWWLVAHMEGGRHVMW